jgi:Lipase maturation factor
VRSAGTRRFHGLEGALTGIRHGGVRLRAAVSEPSPTPLWWLTRFVFFRLLGLVYTVAFLIVFFQWEPLLGSRGLLPAATFLDNVAGASGRSLAVFLRLPTLFWLDASDAAFRVAGLFGLALAMALLVGFANVPSLFLLWLIYLSFVHVGQIFYGYGWEILLLETGFLAIFLAPLWRPWPFARSTPPSPVVILLLRWLAFRLMLGAGLIKLRGDPCWRDLTCLVFHYETQPNPNPLSWYLHQMPEWFHRLEVLFNHLVELVAPFFVFGPRPARLLVGSLLVLFQVLLILSGNLSFLNWMTLTVCVACLDDGAFRGLLPVRLRERVDAAVAGAEEGKARGLACYALAVVVGLLSLNPVANMLSPGQVMNTSFDPFELVNTYGAFGSIGRERYEIVLEGTEDDPKDPQARWQEYDFECKPGTPARRPCWISPYHYRLDWQMWFLAMPDAPRDPWFVHLVAKLLEGDSAARGLLAPGPFETRPPRAIRARHYRYRMTRWGAAERDWWKRELVGEYLPPVTRDDPRLLEYLRRQGWR